jgi:hypothetical protein
VSNVGNVVVRVKVPPSIRIEEILHPTAGHVNRRAVGYAEVPTHSLSSSVEKRGSVEAWSFPGTRSVSG